MEWSEQGVVLSARRHGETSAIADIITRGHGRYRGLVRSGRSRAMRPVLQPGNMVRATWRARLEEHLGNFALEPVSLKAALLIDDPFKLAGLGVLTGLSQLIPEREPHARLYDGLELVLEALPEDALWPALLVRWELGLLDELGFGLDLSRCAATGAREGLVYVSPRTGRAVSRAAGEPYRERLLPLPQFLLGAARGNPGEADLIDAFRLTGHFLDRHIFEPRGIRVPEQRAWVLERLSRR